MSDLIDTTEMYLKTVFELIEDGIVPLRARIAERLGHSGPTVSQTVARLERDGLMVVTGDRHLELTDEGMARATRVMRKHRLAERLLTDVIGLDWPHVHEEACRWEHVMSDQVERRLVNLLDHPQRDPYGNPIPGLADLGEMADEAAGESGATRRERLEGANRRDGGQAHGLALEDALPSGQARFVITRIGEPLQVDVALLTELQKCGIAPGTVVIATRGPNSITVAVPESGAELDLLEDTARHVFARAE